MYTERCSDHVTHYFNTFILIAQKFQAKGLLDNQPLIKQLFQKYLITWMCPGKLQETQSEAKYPKVKVEHLSRLKMVIEILSKRENPSSIWSKRPTPTALQAWTNRLTNNSAGMRMGGRDSILDIMWMYGYFKYESMDNGKTVSRDKRTKYYGNWNSKEVLTIKVDDQMFLVQFSYKARDLMT